MYRSFAILLLAVFSFGLFQPLLLASAAEAALPACCKRHGKHGCSMKSKASLPEDGQKLLASACPMYPAAKSVPSSPNSAVASVSQASSPLVTVEPDSVEQADALFRISFSRAWQKRGPPSLS